MRMSAKRESTRSPVLYTYTYHAEICTCTLICTIIANSSILDALSDYPTTDAVTTSASTTVSRPCYPTGAVVLYYICMNCNCKTHTHAVVKDFDFHVLFRLRVST